MPKRATRRENPNGAVAPTRAYVVHMDTNPDTVAGRVKAAMSTANQSIKGTAEAAGIPLTTYRRKLAGHTDFTVAELARIADALNVAPSTLLPAEFASAA